MLIDFSFSNFKCFSNLQQFSMKRPKGDQESTDGAWKHDDLSSVAAIFGSNASGKSTFLQALQYLCNLVAQTAHTPSANQGFTREAFILDSERSAEPTEFFIEFIADDNNRYQYELSIDSYRVLYEELSVFTSSKTSTLFCREFNENTDDYKYSYGILKGKKSAYQGITRPNVLFLSVLIISDNDHIKPACRFFTEQVNFTAAWLFENALPQICVEVAEGTAHGKALSSILAHANLGIASIKAESEAETFIRGFSMPGDPVLDTLQDFMIAIYDKTNPQASKAERDEYINGIAQSEPGEVKQLFFVHQYGDVSTLLDPSKESRGTLASLAFFSFALNMLSKQSVYVVDELDMSLHPKYVRELIRLFTDPQTNPFQSQLIFTSHDATLMTSAGAENSVLKRDQIWFTEKDTVTGAAELFPLTAFSVRKNENYTRNYLNGVYGATPDLAFHATVAEALKTLIQKGA